jgi:hypothetical protein
MALRAIRGWGRFPRLDFISVTSHSGHAGLTDSVFEMHASHARRERAGLLLVHDSRRNSPTRERLLDLNQPISGPYAASPWGANDTRPRSLR